MVLTVSFVLSPVTGLFCHRRLRGKNFPRKLDASVGASGPHDFAVRVDVTRQRHLRVHRIPPRVRDDRDTPLVWSETAETSGGDLPDGESGIFFDEDWTGGIALIPRANFS
jgi:hypothetical protein